MKLIKQEKLDKKITEKYSSEFTLTDVTKPGIKEFLYYYFYYKNQ